MFRWFQNQIDRWREARKKDAEERLRSLKIRYHIFRAILEANGRAVGLITELDMGLRRDLVSQEGLLKKIDELLSVTYELVEKLNKLDYARHKVLFTKHRKIAKEIKDAIALIPREDGIPLCMPLEQVYRGSMDRLVGNKASVLAGLAASGLFHVPQGFVIPVHACRLFLEKSALTFKIIRSLGRYLDVRQGEVLKLPEQVVDDVKSEIISTPLPSVLEDAVVSQALPFLATPPGLAVRSSAIGEDGLKYSFAGQFTTVLNVTNQADLILAVKEVIASNFNARSLIYRLNAGMSPLDFNMAVLCLKMIDAVSAGILFTQDPNNTNSGRMIISAVFGLGELAVAGESSADIYRPSRTDAYDTLPLIAKKDKRLILNKNGGVRLEDVPEMDRQRPVLTPELIKALVDLGLKIESLSGGPQDIEWAVDQSGVIFILQARPLRISAIQAADHGQGDNVLFDKAVVASRGVATGRVNIIRRRQDLERPMEGAVILVLHQSLVDAARVVKDVNGVLVDIGNPADHLSCVAREHAVPMLTGLATATKDLKDGEWITVDAVSGRVTAASRGEIESALKKKEDGGKRGGAPMDVGVDRGDIARSFQETLHQLIVKLNLTDAYGPTFSIMECRSIHDIVRFVHEKAVIAMFDMGDELLSDAKGLVYKLESDIPFLLSVIDLGGGLVPKEDRGLKITPEEVISAPFRALWKGMTTPGLRWSGPPGQVDLGQTYSHWIADQQSERPIGCPNYVILSRDYINLNARMDFHFVMIDSVCGMNPKANYLRFRFKGGGTDLVRRRRRASLIAELLERHNFFVDLKDDLVNGELSGVMQQVIEERLVFLGRLLGFTRLLDMAMINEHTAHRMVEAFMQGDYQFKGLESVRPAGPAGHLDA
ncbi:PEP/pyruvate-binding domain-containing protein [Dissulfurimicrobium hydrothermale]|uniref:PEP/pyruvate-binding domain-containing protein n=1 Tax=Dissulfurimicrobium hydrothermale TaxID=1750598 RepID=UPI001EDA7340|nr:PEP/pyruvate-binding domain-containing protein [Dissulfurimicrobium hydrothermale]UKL13544.1 pyruvate, phosphate dikinase [Dissulfurimicrobium hydrothermale]